MPYPGQVLNGTYQIVDEIGKGGMGIIYRAWHLNLQKYVVVKKIKDNFVGVLDARSEVDILKSLHHSCLPQVYDFLQIGEEIYTVMDYIDGHDLKYFIDHGYQFEESVLWYWLVQLCDVLEYLHEHGILHLDIKPANIMLTSEGKIYLIDFNISLSGEEQELTGISIYYASPEQYQRWQSLLYGTAGHTRPLDDKTDIYSLGATFYHMMTGVLPTADLKNMYPVTDYHLNYSKNLIGLIDKMMKPDPRQRFRNVSKINAAIKKMQRTKEERMTLRIVFFGMLLGILILFLTIGVLIYRNFNHVAARERKEIQQQEIQLQQLCYEGEYAKAYRLGMEYMNANMEVLERLDGAKSRMLQIMTESCLGMEDYEEALNYAEQLLMLEESSQNYHNAAIASAYLGRYEQANRYLEQAKSLSDSSQGGIIKTMAEIEASQKNYVRAIELYQSLLKNEENASVLRRIGRLALEASNTDGSYAQLAVTYYEKLTMMQNAFYTDQMNLVTGYQKCGMKEKALALLQEMELLYPGEYEIYARDALFRYNIEVKKAPSERDFKKIKKIAEKAVALYDQTAKTSKDELMETVAQLLESLP